MIAPEIFVPKSWKPRTPEERALAFVVRTLGELSTDGLPDEVERAIRRSYERANAALVARVEQSTGTSQSERAIPSDASAERSGDMGPTTDAAQRLSRSDPSTGTRSDEA